MSGTEIWRPVISFGGVFANAYEISDQGRLRSLERFTKLRSGRLRRAAGGPTESKEDC